MTALRQPRVPVRAAGQPGLVTRAVAFAVDAAIIDAVALVCAALMALCLSLVRVSDTVGTVIAAAGGVAFVAWGFGYFITFWSTTGQTPGGRVMAVRVCDAHDGTPIPARRAFVRALGILLAAVPLMAGFLPILLDSRRRGLQDYLARTVVVDASDGGVTGRHAAPSRAPATPERPPGAAAQPAATV